MPEMSKELRIVLLIDIIIGVLFGFFYLIVPEYYSKLIEAPEFDLYFGRIIGGTIIIIAIGGIIALKRGEYKPIMEIAILWFIMALILDTIRIFTCTSSATYTRSLIMTIVILSVLIIINSYYYYRESKKLEQK